MNDRWIAPQPSAPAEETDTASSFSFDPTRAPRPAAPLAPGTRIGAYELQRVLARGAATVVYLGVDHALAIPVAIQEYLPARLVERDPERGLQPLEPRHVETIERGRLAFVAEARMLARCDHPALLRVLQLFESGGSTFRVMPYHRGQRLLDLRRQMPGAPDEASLRALLDGLLGALEALHRNGSAHGGVSPENILLLSDDRPLLLGPGAAGSATGADLVDSLMASIDGSGSAGAGASAPPAGSSAADLLALADVMRFCITGEVLPARPREPLAVAIAKTFEPAQRPHYSPALLGTLDAAASSLAEDRPLGAAQWRQWLDSGALRQRHDIAPEPAAVPPQPPQPQPPTLTLHDIRPVAPPQPTLHDIRPAVPQPQPGASPGPTFASDWIEPDPESAARAGISPRPLRAPTRWQLASVGAALAVVAAGALAVALGVWDPLTPLNWGRSAELPAALITPPPQQQPQPPAQQPAAQPAPLPTTPTTPTTTPTMAPTAAAPQPPEPVATAAAPPAPVAAASASGLAAAPPPAVRDAAEPLAAAAAVEAPPAAPVAAARPTRAARSGIESSAAGPLAACAGKTDFARYRCAQAQCRMSRWAAHPQCVRLRTRDDVG